MVGAQGRGSRARRYDPFIIGVWALALGFLVAFWAGVVWLVMALSG